MWVTESVTAAHRGDGRLPAGTVELLLDGQQRMTSLYGVVRGRSPKFFDGDERAFTGLHFHLDEEVFEFYQPVKMRDDSRWIDVTELMRRGTGGIGTYVERFSRDPGLAPKLGVYVARLGQLLAITDITLHAEQVTGSDKTLDTVVDIFNRVNSGGTKLSKGDLALAKICAHWPDARRKMQEHLGGWSAAGYRFSLDWLLRSVNTTLTGEAKFQFLHERAGDEIDDGLRRAANHIDTCLNLIGSRLGLDHDRVLFGRYAIPIMVRHLDLRKQKKLGSMSAEERDRLLFWFLQAGMWGRFSGTTETMLDQDLEALEGPDGGLGRLLDNLRIWRGALRAQPENFAGWGIGARFYPVLYLLTRTGDARDFCSGGLLKAGLLGPMNRLEVHHIFPKARLYKYQPGYHRSEVNALGNFCFLTKDCNLQIGDRLPEDYLSETRKRHPGVLASQWIPEDERLWKMENFREFLAARRKLLADAMNRLLLNLLHGETRWMVGEEHTVPPDATTVGGISSDEERTELERLNEWAAQQGLPRGEIGYDFADPDSGAPRAVFDLAWPDGVQTGLSQRVAVLLNEGPEVVALAGQAGYRTFESGTAFKDYAKREILGQDGNG